MIYRTTTPSDIAPRIEGHHGDDFNLSEWLDDTRNIALVNDKGDVNLFQFQTDGLYCGHFFYLSRGKQAVETAQAMLKAVFNYEEVRVIMGLTPVDQLGAKWLSRKLGFSSHGIVETPPGPCEMFILTRLEYEGKN